MFSTRAERLPGDRALRMYKYEPEQRAEASLQIVAENTSDSVHLAFDYRVSSCLLQTETQTATVLCCTVKPHDYNTKKFSSLTYLVLKRTIRT